ncbi:glycine betaine ABC transporter substrate-binding protein [Cohnella thailandensis]|uniref:Glycine betaine ABC transporter substrate-binding protein n=1 Tax=Cohnella thailandensis TaxID=557557 RepID=A0A841SW07_9BACL|nr:glycine betaine ABC transporter substrate-binding protein [Cohnella thailandensis]MBB6633807.1 glycine betaine ABC transporter substrate-binding protein [Cohnella thailandensis]MBP1972488.1 glycine betaine/proline transport system substrate-binding protein [Cohnella thailandensis]
MRKWGLLLSLVLIIGVLAGCSEKSGDKSIKLAYVAWDSEIASTNVVREVLETKLGYKVEMLQVDAGPMWTGIADGSADAMVAAWLPSTHASYMEKYASDIEDLGPNLNGTKTGLTVPAYMDITSIEDLKNADTLTALDGQIIGIEPGAGIMMATEKAMEEYALSDYKLVESSSAAMAQELQKAYDAQKPIVVTGWTPHWMFAKMDLKYLEDPKGVYGGDEQIHTVVRKGLKEDKADAYAFLDKFEWTPDDMAAVMVAIQEGASPEDAAKDWVAANEDKVNAWVEGIE